MFPAKYRRAVFDEAVDAVLRDVCHENREALRDQVCGDWRGQRPCAFLGSVSANVKCDKTGDND